MLLPTLLPLAVAFLAHLAVASRPPSETPHSPWARRNAALRDSPTGTYAPKYSKCPAAGVKIRQGQTLNSEETTYIQSKTETSLADWTSYLTNVGLEGLNLSSFVPTEATAVPGETVPLVGIASAFDNRVPASVAAKTGGVLQLAQYLAGLSGTSWLVGSHALSSAPTMEALRDTVWKMDENLLLPPKSNPNAYSDVIGSITRKRLTGAPVSNVDAYGRMISYHFTNDTRSFLDISSGPGAATLWSSIKSTSAYKSSVAPFPIITALNRTPGTITLNYTAIQYEMTPIEFGTNLPSSGGLFVPMEYLGTSFDKGAPTSPNKCMTGFDNAGFLMGSSSNVFGPVEIPVAAEAKIYLNQVVVNVTAIQDNARIQSALASIPDEYVNNGRVPNPFSGFDGFSPANQSELFLSDGGLGLEIIPYWPLIQPQRKNDVIVSVDATSESSDFYPNGLDIHNTYLMSLLPGYETPFPFIPDPTSFVTQGLTKRPSFFGSSCVAQPNNITTPLIVYLPNYDESFKTGVDTFTMSFSKVDQAGFFKNGFQIATQNSSTSWPTCLACALVDAQQARNGISRTAQCTKCFDQYCYASSSE